jgi:hypothetical protein
MDILGLKPSVLSTLEVGPLCCKILNSRVWQAKNKTSPRAAAMGVLWMNSFKLYHDIEVWRLSSHLPRWSMNPSSSWAY